MNGPNFPPEVLAQMMGHYAQHSGPHPSSEVELIQKLDPELIHTREQLRTLWVLINQVESLTKIAERPEDEVAGPVVVICDEQARIAASSVVMTATNRINDILCDDRRWRRLPAPSKRLAAASELNAETEAMAKRQELTERISG